MPQVVFHAAAYKHVPMMEKHPQSALRNNVIGRTKNLGWISRSICSRNLYIYLHWQSRTAHQYHGCYQAHREMIIQEMNRKSYTNFAAVRFGNVLGSSGSVTPFSKNDPKRRPRYCHRCPNDPLLHDYSWSGSVSNPSRSYGPKGGEAYCPGYGWTRKDIRPGCRFNQAARAEPEKDIKIEITGIRPGEKLYEELLKANEKMTTFHISRSYLVSENGHQSTNVLELVDKLIVYNAFLLIQ